MTDEAFFSPLQWGAAVFEFGTTWLLIQKDGKCYKEDVRGVYDVSLSPAGLRAWVMRESPMQPANNTMATGINLLAHP
jgi:hypothetical protein